MPADHEAGHDLGLAGVHAVRAPGHVDDGLRERLVHRDPGVAEAADARLVAEGLLERLPEHDGDVLDGVVRVDRDVAGGPDDQVEPPCLPSASSMWSKNGTPVDTSVRAGAVEVDLDEHARLLGHALHASGPAHDPQATGPAVPPVAAGHRRTMRTCTVPVSPGTNPSTR